MRALCLGGAIAISIAIPVAAQDGYARISVGAAIPLNNPSVSVSDATLGLDNTQIGRVGRSLGFAGDIAAGVVLNNGGDTPVSIGFAIGGSRTGLDRALSGGVTSGTGVPISGNSSVLSFMPEVRVAQNLDDDFQVFAELGAGGAHRKINARSGDLGLPAFSFPANTQIVNAGGLAPAWKAGFGLAYRADPSTPIWIEGFVRYQGVGSIDVEAFESGIRAGTQHDFIAGIGARYEFGSEMTSRGSAQLGPASTPQPGYGAALAAPSSGKAGATSATASFVVVHGNANLLAPDGRYYQCQTQPAGSKLASGLTQLFGPANRAQADAFTRIFCVG